jgi:Ca2+-binding EF-hand superfamily protein
VTSLQNGSTDWICEQDDIKNKTLPKLREELINIIDKENFAEEIGDIFNLVNENADDGIDMKEFRNLLFTLNIQLNNEEIQCLFRVLNVSGK